MARRRGSCATTPAATPSTRCGSIRQTPAIRPALLPRRRLLLRLVPDARRPRRRAGAGDASAHVRHRVPSRRRSTPRRPRHEDALTAYRHLLAQGIAPSRIVLAGDSAGGTLVLSTLLALRDRGRAAAGGRHRDLAVGRPLVLGRELPDERPVRLRRRDGTAGWRRRATWTAPIRERPDISPLFADLRGLPPLLIQAGGAEVLVDQIRAFADARASAGADMTLSVYDDMVHVWHLMRDVTPDGQRAIDEAGAFAGPMSPDLGRPRLPERRARRARADRDPGAARRGLRRRLQRRRLGTRARRHARAHRSRRRRRRARFGGASRARRWHAAACAPATSKRSPCCRLGKAQGSAPR